MNEKGTNPAADFPDDAASVTEMLASAVAEHRAGRLQQAEAGYRAVLGREPRNAEALHLMGVMAQQVGQHQTSFDFIQRAISVRPQEPAYYANLSTALEALGRLDDAVAAIRQALALDGKVAQWHRRLALLLHQMGSTDEAIDHYRQALELEPDDAATRNNLGVALFARGEIAAAVEQYRASLGVDESRADTHNNLGLALQNQGKVEEARAEYEAALKLQPDYADAHYNFGLLLHDTSRLDAAVEHYEAALQRNERLVVAHNNLGNALTNLGELDRAIAHLRQALQLKPDYALAHSNLLFALNYHPALSPQLVAAEHQRWGEVQGRGPVLVQPHDNAPEPERRLRVGVVSPDLRSHSVAYFIAPFFRHHDKKTCELYAYASVRAPDDMTATLKGAADHWRDVAGWSDERLARAVREDGIDILLDLAGHTRHSRLAMFAHRPAPVQVGYLGYPNTTGLPAMDYRITDEVADPPGSEGLYTEHLERLPTGFLCYSPPADVPSVAPPPSSSNGFVTFGSFNDLAKLNDGVVDLWCAILRAVPDSRLLLKTKYLVDEATCARVRRRFGQRGIDGGRLDLRPWAKSNAEHMASYANMDIALDTFPYNGTTTTCEALWMGVPVVVLRGDRHAGRVGVSILSHAGLEDLIADDPGRYREIAVALAKDAGRRAALRESLRGTVSESALCDGRAYTLELQDAMRRMWRRWCRERHPRPSS
jgi:protein O-GlcNAc transferase